MPLKNSEKEAGALKAQQEPALRALYKKTFGREPESFEPLKADGSARRLYRMRDGDRSAIGAFGPDKAENRAFLSFSRQFRAAGLPVPELYAEEAAQGIYLEEDLAAPRFLNISPPSAKVLICRRRSWPPTKKPWTGCRASRRRWARASI